MLRLQHASPLKSTLWALQAVPLGAHQESLAVTLTLLSVIPLQNVSFNVKCQISTPVGHCNLCNIKHQYHSKSCKSDKWVKRYGGLTVFTEGLKSVASASVRWPTEEVLSMRAVLWDALIPVPATMADAAPAARFASQKYAVRPPGHPPRC